MFERYVARSENKSICCGGRGDETPPEEKKKTISAAICVKQWSETATDVCKTLRVIKTMDVAFRLPESPCVHTRTNQRLFHRDGEAAFTASQRATGTGRTIVGFFF